MRFGIRAQLLLAIGALLVLAFLPLFFAVASLTRASHAQSWQRHARALGRAIAGHVSEARTTRPPDQLAALLTAQTGQGVGAIGVYDAAGSLTIGRGEPGAVEALPATVAINREQLVEVTTRRGPAMVVVVPDTEGSVGALVHTDPSATRVAPLVRLLALYTGLLALALLVFLYFVLTRIVVAPIDQLSRAAGKVAAGDRELSVPRSGGRELLELGSSLATMTTSLRAEERKLREKIDELRRTTEELQRAQDTVIRTERLASVGRLAAGLAHEIGNPISAILSFQELLLDGELDDDQRDFIERMKRETERVNRVLRDLLDFARPAAKGDGLPADDLGASASMAEAIEHIDALVRPQKSFNGVELLCVVEEGLPPVAMDHERVEQVLLNLLLNAADAVPRPGGRVAIEAQLKDDQIRVHIEDNGGGIEPSIRGSLFEPFVSTKEVGKGTGLGLAVCRGLVESAGGTIDVEEGAEGARFVLGLPVACPDSA